MLFDAPFVPLLSNADGRDFAIGDLHGCLHMLKPLLEKVGFDRATDRLFSVGDLIHRGPSSIDCLLLAESPWFYSVRGNHEAIQLGAWQSHLLNGRSLRSICVNNGGADLLEWDVDAERLGSIIERLPLAIEFPLQDGRLVGLIHAGIQSPHSWRDVQEISGCDPCLYDNRGFSLQRNLLWDRSAAYAAEAALATSGPGDQLNSIADTRRLEFHKGSRPLEGLDLLVAGHTSLDTRTPLKFGQRLLLDTGAGYNGGPLTMVELATGRFWTSPDPATEPDPIVSGPFRIPEVKEVPSWLSPDERLLFNVKD